MLLYNDADVLSIYIYIMCTLYIAHFRDVRPEYYIHATHKYYDERHERMLFCDLHLYRAIHKSIIPTSNPSVNRRLIPMVFFSVRLWCTRVPFYIFKKILISRFRFRYTAADIKSIKHYGIVSRKMIN